MTHARTFLTKHILAFLALAWTLCALGVWWQYDLVNRKLDADASFMLYAGQQMLRGHAPYVGVTIVKLPVSPFVAAAGIAVGRAFGVDDIVAGRLAFWLCAGLTVGAVFLIGAQLAQDLIFKLPKLCKFRKFEEVWIGGFAAAILLSFQTFGVQAAEGPEAKFPMVAAGMMCLVFIAREKFFLVGISSALSFMAWQPGLIFIIAALLAAFFVPFRKRALLQTLAGIALPIVLIGAYLALNDALASMFRQTFSANANYLDEKKIAPGIVSIVLANVNKVWDVSLECSAAETPFIVLGYVGMLGGALFLGWRMIQSRDAKLFLRAFLLLLSGAALFGFSLLDLQKCSDLVPLLPYLALGAAGLLLVLLLFVSRFLARALSQDDARIFLALGSIVLVALLLFGVRDAFTLPRQKGLPQQRALAQEIAARLQPADRVQQFGDTVFLVVTQRENATRFVHLGEKQGLGILTAEGVTMDALVTQLQQANPRVITLSRAKNKTWAAPLYAWIEAQYTLETPYGAAEGGTQKETDVWWRK